MLQMRQADTILAFVRDNPETNIRYKGFAEEFEIAYPVNGTIEFLVDVDAVKRTTFHGSLLWKRNWKRRFILDLQSGHHSVALPAAKLAIDASATPRFRVSLRLMQFQRAPRGFTEPPDKITRPFLIGHTSVEDTLRRPWTGLISGSA